MLLIVIGRDAFRLKLPKIETRTTIPLSLNLPSLYSSMEVLDQVVSNTS
jgi:hypothetical protein